jgi:GH35 family endo-1,4-beta-xylanase
VTSALGRTNPLANATVTCPYWLRTGALVVFLFWAGTANALIQTLREEAARAGIQIGTAVRPAQLSEAAYSATLAREFNMVEPEDTLKWWVLRPDSQTFDFR